jgi:hypothetical protein
MILKTYLWRKHGDPDYVAPKIQLINQDLFSPNKNKIKKIIEAVSLKEKIILVQFCDAENQVQLLVVY